MKVGSWRKRLSGVIAFGEENINKAHKTRESKLSFYINNGINVV